MKIYTMDNGIVHTDFKCKKDKVWEFTGGPVARIIGHFLGQSEHFQ